LTFSCIFRFYKVNLNNIEALFNARGGIRDSLSK
jgi:hypothetical protein